jgi:hypothetical protein
MCQTVTVSYSTAQQVTPGVYRGHTAGTTPQGAISERGTMIQRGRRVADNFTIISNDHLRDERLSWAARGLLGWLCSHAEGYEITEATIVAAGPMKRDGIRTLLRELEGLGYLRRDRRSVIEGGSVVDYILTDPTLARVGESDPRADQGKQVPGKDESAGQGPSSPRVGESDPRSSTEKTMEKTNTKTSSSLRATRLPENFQPDEKMRAWFAAERLGSVIDGVAEHAKFVDYFAGAPGVKGRKCDWAATWRNWMRTAAERASRRPGNSLVPTSGAPRQYPSTTDGKVMQTLGLAEKFRQMEESQ